MSPRWIMFFIGCFLGLSILSMIIEGGWFTAADLSVFNVISNPSILWTSNANFMHVSGIIALPANLLELLWDTLTFDYSFLTGNMIYLRFFFCCFTFGFLWGVAQLIRGTSS